MSHTQQVWDEFAGIDPKITVAFGALIAKGLYEYDILNWLCIECRREASLLDSSEAEIALIKAGVIQATAKEIERVLLAAADAGSEPPNLDAVPELTGRQRENELSAQLLPLLDEGVDELEILRGLAFWRKEVALDEERRGIAPLDNQIAGILYSAAEKLESAMDEWAEADPLVPLELEPSQQIHRSVPKVGRNDPCPCKSGKKFKKCHGS